VIVGAIDATYSKNLQRKKTPKGEIYKTKYNNTKEEKRMREMCLVKDELPQQQ
jgi:hypothetical protein